VSERQQVSELAARLHLPDPDFAPTRPFFAAAERGELVIPRCADCATWVWYPQAICPACGRRRIGWTPVSGRGRIFTWVRAHRSFLPGLQVRVPYVTALVELDEHPSLRLAALLVEDGREPTVGATVEVEFEKLDEPPHLTVPRFRIVEPTKGRQGREGEVAGGKPSGR